MNSKKINLWFWAALPIIPAFLLTVFCLDVYDRKLTGSIAQLYSIPNYHHYADIHCLFRSQKDIDDESAQEAMAKANAVSIKIISRGSIQGMRKV